MASEYLSLALAVVSGASTAIGLSKLIEFYATRRTRKSDDKDAEQVKFDQTALQVFHDEIQELKSETRDIRGQLNSQLMLNQKLEIENKHLRDANERQETELTELRRRTRELSAQVLELTNIVSELRAQNQHLEAERRGRAI